MTAPADSAGITGVPAVLPLGRLAAHPRNPRADLGDLAELTASVAAHGVFEPLVVMTIGAYTTAAGADGDPERPAGECTHVIVMGHRRAAAARAAGLAEVPVVVRDDLAGAAALAAMIAENAHREGLAPLAEARAMAELARRGWGQRRIAAETGCSQAHVSKRMSLLRLPEAARDAVDEGHLTVSDALELLKIHGGADQDIAEAQIAQAAGKIGAGQRPDWAIDSARREAARAMAERKARADLAARGIKIVSHAERDRKGWPRVWDGMEGPHEKAGCLAAVIGWGGHPEWACTRPDSHAEDSPVQQRARESEDERESRAAARARGAACAALAAAPLPGPADLARILSATLLDSGAGHSEALRQACKWLRDAGIAPDGTGHYDWRDQLARAADHAGIARYAWAYTLASGEAGVRYHSSAWGDAQAAHLARLTAAGYQPTAWEAARLEEARQVAAARDTLACPSCGCAGAPGCRVEFDRQAGRPAYRCAWDCAPHKAAARAAALDELLLGLIVAVDHATAAGSRLPAGVDDAIDGPRAQLAAAYRDRRDGDGRDSVLAAARGLAAAAAPWEHAWTPELAAALNALAAHGAHGGEGGRR